MASYGSRFNDDAGGGFLQGSQSNTQSPGGGRAKAENTLRPVTIKQVMEADFPHADAVAFIQDIEVVNVSFCAIVREITRQTTNVLFKIEDGSGTVEARKWMESNDGETDGLDTEMGVQERDWVRVVGKINNFNSKRYVNASRITKITDFNQINYHLLDAMRVTLEYDRGSSGGNYMAIDHTNGGAPNVVKPSYKHDNLPPKQAKIMTYLESQDLPEAGLHLEDIAHHCSMTLEEVSNETAQLITAGELYSTSDDN
ncbi:hypothetical protein DFH28DRAFT_1082834 [Melampsora americana]|nr:hypothetical protein DFH28DRAFT_1082834 [Melampsora americana]